MMMTSHVQPHLITCRPHLSIVSRFTTGGIADWFWKETSGFQSGFNLMRNARPALSFGYFYISDVTERHDRLHPLDLITAPAGHLLELLEVVEVEMILLLLLLI